MDPFPLLDSVPKEIKMLLLVVALGFLAYQLVTYFTSQKKVGAVNPYSTANTITTDNRLGYDPKTNRYFVTATISNPDAFREITVDTTSDFLFDHVTGVVHYHGKKQPTPIATKCFNVDRPVMINDYAYSKVPGWAGVDAKISEINLVFWVGQLTLDVCPTNDYPLAEKQERLRKLRPELFLLDGKKLNYTGKYLKK